jgi:hypothetical protein
MWFNSVQILVLIGHLCILFVCVCVEHIVLVLHEFLSCSKKCGRIVFIKIIWNYVCILFVCFCRR